MATTKTTKIVYWTSTAIIFLFEGVMPALTSHTDLAVEGIRHLGYPDYFRVMLSVFKVLGCLALVLPFVNGRIKEWAYAGLSFTMLSACISHWVVDGLGQYAIFPLFILSILILSYVSYHRLNKESKYLSKPSTASTRVVSGLAH
ncbi:DoxX family protein [Telluribacter sp.]|jgi:uncharacterized membrane protein YphA (DoxX/SURF4 family)|uniref:DoxX family protein n=1 Tax=Telluribacter sp. TaxID=1978767 RepID=UPI002E11893E|nr:DoxX family protein [Telluribacter sp.]